MVKSLVRSRGRGLGAWWFVAGLALALLSCSADKEEARGQLMLALQTDMALPKDVSSVRILVLVNGAPRFDRTYPVGPEGAKIPATLAIVAGDDPSTPVELKVLAFRDSEVRTLNRTITTIPESRIALLRVPIEWLCDGFVKNEGEDEDEYASTCEPVGDREQACSGGVCRDVVVAAAELPTFRAADVFGGGTPSGGGRCFPVQSCFDDGFDVTPVASNCRVELGTDADAPLNFALVPENGDGACSEESGSCYVPLDQSDFGWSELDPPSEGRRSFRLPVAVCDRLADGSVRAVRGTTACDTKTLAIPPCGPGSSVDEPLEPGEEFPVSGEGGEGGAGHAGGAGQAGEGGVPSDAGAGGVPSGSGGAGSGGVPSDAGTGGAEAGAGGGPTVVTPCDPNPCANGTCMADGDFAVCDCADGFEGPLCENAVASFSGIGFIDGGTVSHAIGASAGGEFVLGQGVDAAGTSVPFVWASGTTPTPLPHLSSTPGSHAYAISEDGTTVVGNSFDELGASMAVKWTLVGTQALTSDSVTVPVSGTVMVMPPVSLGVVPPYTDSVAHDVSADGSVIVGDVSIESGEREPFTWTEADGLQNLGFLGSAVAVSDDGRVIACNDANGALFWTEAGGPVGLGTLNEARPIATDLTADGGTIVGVTDYEYFRWSLVNGVDSNDYVLSESSFTDLSTNRDGSVLVGTLSSGEPAVWDEENGWRYLRDALADAGVPYGDWFLQNAAGVSPDGTLVVGQGTDETESSQGYVVRLPLRVNVRECVDPDPCLAGATCSERIVGYACNCPPGRVGRNCGILEAEPFFDGRDPVINAIGPDGSVFVGESTDPSGYSHPTLWRAPDMATQLPLPGAAMSAYGSDVSDDGTVVVGDGGSEAFRWTLASGSVGLGFFAGTESQYSSATAVSGDGATVVGRAYNQSVAMEAFRWTEGGGMQGLGFLSADTESQAHDVNTDGSVIVGQSGTSGIHHAFRWTAQGMLELTPPEAADWAAAYAVNADGSVVVGSYASQAGSQAFRWTAALGVVNLGAPAGVTSMEALGVSADGNVVVGRAYTSERIEAFVWKATHGTLLLGDALQRQGIDSAGLLLGGANAISGDGVTITGSADDSFDLEQVPWLVELPR